MKGFINMERRLHRLMLTKMYELTVRDRGEILKLMKDNETSNGEVIRVLKELLVHVKALSSNPITTTKGESNILKAVNVASSVSSFAESCIKTRQFMQKVSEIGAERALEELCTGKDSDENFFKESVLATLINLSADSKSTERILSQCGSAVTALYGNDKGRNAKKNIILGKGNKKKNDDNMEEKKEGDTSRDESKNDDNMEEKKKRDTSGDESDDGRMEEKKEGNTGREESDNKMEDNKKEIVNENQSKNENEEEAADNNDKVEDFFKDFFF